MFSRNNPLRMLGGLAGIALIAATAWFAYQWLGAGVRSGNSIAGNANPRPGVTVAQATARQGGAEQARGTETPQPVRVVMVKLGTVRDEIRQTAALASTRVTPVFSRLTLIVRNVRVEEGDAVRAGQLLMQLEDEELRLNAEQASIALDRDAREWKRQQAIYAEALDERKEYREAKFAFDSNKVQQEKAAAERIQREAVARRTAASYQENLVSKQERDDANFAADQARFLEAQARLELRRAREEWTRIQALDKRELIDEKEYTAARFAHRSSRAALALSKLKVRQAAIRAPADGVVTERLVDPGDSVSPNMRLMTLADLNSLEAVVHLPELQWRDLRAGQTVSVRPEALPGVEVQGRVKRVNPVIDPANGTFKVTIAVEGSAAGRVRPGMFVTIVIRTAIRENSLLIPRQAVLGDEGVRYVYLALEGTARRREIRLGTVLESEVEVRSGLEEGNAVVVVGQHRLKPGSPVQVLK